MVLEKFIEGITNQDLAFLESLLHEDMLFVQETTLETKEEWIKDTKEQFKNGMLDATKMEVTKIWNKRYGRTWGYHEEGWALDKIFKRIFV